jgi:hypothetical protein
MAKVDFILRREDCLIPVEVHIDENTRSKVQCPEAEI